MMFQRKRIAPRAPHTEAVISDNDSDPDLAFVPRFDTFQQCLWYAFCVKPRGKMFETMTARCKEIMKENESAAV